jgi:hypothetical protein
MQEILIVEEEARYIDIEWSFCSAISKIKR